MEKDDDSILRESLDGLRRVEEDRRKDKKEKKEERVQSVLTEMAETEAANARQASLVAIAFKEKSWPLVANQVWLTNNYSNNTSFKFKSAFAKFKRRVEPEHQDLTHQEVYMVFVEAIALAMTKEQKEQVEAEMIVLKDKRSPQPKAIFCTYLSVLNPQ